MDGGAMQLLKKLKESWVCHGTYRNPGPIQYEGEVANDINITLQTEREGYAKNLKEVEQQCARLLELCRAGCPSKSLQTAVAGLRSVTQVLEILAER